MKGVEKKFGKTMSNFATEIEEKEIVSYSTGSKLIDLAIGSGQRAGLPEGRMIELYGAESVGKSTIALLAIAERQRIENKKSEEDPEYEKKVCVFIDSEFALDTDLAVEYGVDLSELIIVRSDQAEDAMDILDSYIRTGGVGLAVVDSVSALIPSQIEQSSYHQQTMAVLARFMSQLTARMTGPAWKSGTTILFINQIREQPGKWAPHGQVATTTPGGRALKYHSTVRLEVRRGETLGAVDNPKGHVMNIKVVKNKIDIPGRTAAVKLHYGIGVDTVEELGEIAIAYGIIHQGGAWFKAIDKETGELLEFEGEAANFQGRDKLFTAIEENTELREYIEKQIDGFELEED